VGNESELSWGITPSPEDVTAITRVITEFQSATEPQAEEIFEGSLSELARAISERFARSKEDAWLTELRRLVAATEAVEAENISAIADAILFERPTLALLRDDRHFGLLRRDYTPEEDIYKEVDTTGATIVATATGYRVNGKGFPIFEGNIKAMNVSGAPIDTFEFVTGSGSRSHRITNGPLPPGRYTAHNFHTRDDLGFVVDGVGYSVNLDEMEGTSVYGRKYFRIHPDGWPLGTKGCIGIRGEKSAQRRAMEIFESMLKAPGGNREVVFAMQYVR
jgi:hypothetical protein